MSIGAALAEARRRSGLSVTELSRRTRVREPVIRAIETDDFSRCGGDFYARGHVRALARAVGIDPEPLLSEYDATQRTTRKVTDRVVLHPGASSRRHRRQRAAWITAVQFVAVAVFGLGVLGSAGYYLAARTTAARRSGASATAHHPSGSATPRGAASSSRPAPTVTPSASTHAPPPAQPLAVASATAFGTDGAADGDNPQSAGLAIDGNTSTDWKTDWYTTAAFGNLKQGTGLLLDMGRQVTVTSAEVTLGSSAGADLQLQAGNSATPGTLHEVASASDAGGVVHLNVATAVHAHYLLLWFTKLPPDTAGTFQADVYNVAVAGHS